MVGHGSSFFSNDCNELHDYQPSVHFILLYNLSVLERKIPSNLIEKYDSLGALRRNFEEKVSPIHDDIIVLYNTSNDIMATSCDRKHLHRSQ